MRAKTGILLLLCMGMNTHAQERFFTFVEGWRALKIIEQENGEYLSVGLSVSTTGQFGHYQFNLISMEGQPIDNWELALENSASSQSLLTNDFHFTPWGTYVTGIRLNLTEDTVFGTVFNLDTEFQSVTNKNDFMFGEKRTFIRSSHIVNDSTVVFGAISRVGSTTDFASLVKADVVGNIEWRMDFSCGPGNCNPFPHHILSLSDGGYIFTLQEEHLCPTLAVEDIRSTLIRTDSQGNEIWRVWPGTDLGTYRSGPWTVQTSDGNLLFAYTDVYTNACLPQPNNLATIRFVKINLQTGETIWEKDLMNELPNGNTHPQGWGRNYQLTQIQAVDDGIILVGSGGSQGMSVKVNEDGEHLWHRFYDPSGMPAAEHGADVTMDVLGMSLTSDGGFIMAGEYVASPGNFFPNGIQTAFALKVDEYGCLEPDCQLADTLGTGINEAVLPQVRIYPNPATDVLYVEVSDNRFEIEEIRITDVLSRNHQLSPWKGGVATGRGGLNSWQGKIDVSYLPNGIYILTLQYTNGAAVSRKFVKE